MSRACILAIIRTTFGGTDIFLYFCAASRFITPLLIISRCSKLVLLQKCSVGMQFASLSGWNIASYVTEDKSTKCVQESAYEVKIMGTFTYKIILNTYLYICLKYG